jgi:uncharacterized membrane protein YfcA
MTEAFAWLLMAMAIGASFLGGMLGMASGIFLVPLLTITGHLTIRTAVGLGLVSVISCSCASAPTYLDARLTNIRLATVLEVATTTGALVGVLASGLFPPPLLSLLFAVVMLVSAWQMVRPRIKHAVPGADARAFARRLDGVYRDRERQMDIAYHVDRLPLGMAMMFGAGLLSALLGIGSGVLKIPAMDAALRLPIQVSSATSNFMIGVTAAAGAIGYCLVGTIDPTVAAPICLGSVIGSVAGAHALSHLRPQRLRILTAVILSALALEMLLAAAGIIPMATGG